MEPVVGRERPIGGALATLDTGKRQIPIVSDYFSEEYSLYPERRVELSINLILEAALVSRTPNHMSRVELEEIV